MAEQHVVTWWQRVVAGSSGPFKTSCGRRNWEGAGEHDPLCRTCAERHGLQPGSRG